MARYRKKPVVIEAFQWLGDNSFQLGMWVSQHLQDRSAVPPNSIVDGPSGRSVQIVTLEGVMLASPGDWIIRGVQCEVYPCKPDIFEATYELVEGE